MPPSWHFDWTTFWLLAGIAMAEGFRRVPAGGVLLRRVPGYPWQVAAGPYGASGWRLTSAFSPFALHALLQPAEGTARPLPKRGSIRLWINLLRVPSLLSLVALLVGVPLLSLSMGTTGLILAVAAALGASLLTAMVAMVAMVRLGTGWKTAAWDALRVVSPFTAPRAPEIVLERALAGVPVVETARALLPAGDFAAWIRPIAYDQVKRDADHALLPRDEAERIIRALPADAAPGDAWCPRCAGVYHSAAATCRGCDVPLERVIAPAAAPLPKSAVAGASR